MKLTSLKLVVIIAEAVLEDQLLLEIKKLGAKGYTVSQVRGEGSRGVRTNEWERENSKIETVVSPKVADEILTRLAEKYFSDYAVIVYVHDVGVSRGEKYV
jgi:nitrogen regulatory protein PII